MARLRVTIRGELGHISAQLFVATISKSLTVLQDLDKRLSEQRGGSVRWVISGLGTGSSYVDLETRPIRGDRDYGEPVLERFTEGIEQIGSKGRTPPHFSQDDMAALREIARTVAKDGAAGVDYGFANRSVGLTPDTASELEQLVGVRYRTFGSVEGKVELVSVKKGARRFNLTSDRTQRSIKCDLPDELEDSVFEAIKDRRRVVVTGLIAYNAKHEPISIKVQEPVRFLGREEELPSIRDLGGSDPDFTGELSTEDYVRSLRGG